MRTAPPVVPAEAVRQLHESVLSSQRHARTQLQAIQDIERRHRHTPLAVLAELAVHRALSPATPTQEEDPLR